MQVVPDRARDEVIDQHQYLGQPIDRVDGREKVTGTATFSAEYKVEGLTHAALVYSTIASGSIEAIDTADAERAPGVIAVITHENAPKMHVAPLLGHGGYAGTTRLEMLNTTEIAWNGQPVAVVVADTEERAEHAASLVRVTYTAKPAVLMLEDARASAKKPDSVLNMESEIKKGNAEELLRSAPFSVDRTYETPRHNHNAIELHGAIAIWKDDSVTLYDPTQFVNGAAVSLEKIFGLKKGAVRVLAPFVGGGFGGKGGIWAHNQLCVLAAKVTGRPVRLVLSREGVFRAVGGRTASSQRVALGADESGKFLSVIHTGITSQSTTNTFQEPHTFPVRHLYASESFFISQSIVDLNSSPNTFMRAPGESIGTFALESAIDELSYELGIDPIELRMRNEPTVDPTAGTEFSSRHLREAYSFGAERFHWARRPAAVASQRDGDWLIGQGVATGTYPMYRYPTSTRIRLRADGTALAQTASQEMGMGTATVQAQHLAERLALPMSKVRFEYGDSSLPAGMVAGGSTQTVSIALAIEHGCEELKKELLSLVRHNPDSPLHGADAESVHNRKGGLYRRNDPNVGETYVSILARARKEFVEVEAHTGQAFEILKYSMHSYCAQFCEVRVNAVTGELRIARFLGSFDTGRILNPKTAVSQFRGGIIMGIGLAMTEETLVDSRTGRIVNPSLAEYHVPVQADVPDLDILFTDIPDPYTPLGAHGIGEIGITGVGAAIANAVYHATGKRIRSLPITLDKLM
jgi:xanthine dehydrogenase YagR molybdenum-binding subunit